MTLPEPTFPVVADTRRASVADIVQHVVQSTVEAGMVPGDRLPPERRLVEMLGVGRSPLREALKCLDIIGFIDIRPGDGTYISTEPSSMLPRAVSWGVMLGSRQADELIEARLFLEAALVRLATERGSEREFSQLATFVAQMASASTSAQFAQADNSFHLAIAQAADNSALSSMLVSIKSLLAVWVVRVVDQIDDRSRLVAQHERILSAMQSHDAEAAAAAMVDHINDVTALLRRTVAA